MNALSFPTTISQFNVNSNSNDHFQSPIRRALAISSLPSVYIKSAFKIFQPQNQEEKSIHAIMLNKDAMAKPLGQRIEPLLIIVLNKGNENENMNAISYEKAVLHNNTTNASNGHPIGTLAEKIKRYPKPWKPELSTIRYGRWTAEENAKLLTLIAIHGEEFNIISEQIKGRTAEQCRRHWKGALNPEISHSPWSAKEDAKIRFHVSKRGTSHWMELAKQLGNRTPHQCMLRWERHLDSKISHNKSWSTEEDEKVYAHVSKYGASRWADLAKKMGNRTAHQCSIRWNFTLNPHISHDKWSEEEDEKIRVHMAKYGTTHWTELAKQLGNRTSHQCSARSISLDPNITRGKWSEAENAKLSHLVNTYGEKWEDIAKKMKNRSRQQCRTHWRKLQISSKISTKKRACEHSTDVERPKKRARKKFPK
jgi:hypothetical protein